MLISFAVSCNLKSYLKPPSVLAQIEQVSSGSGDSCSVYPHFTTTGGRLIPCEGNILLKGRDKDACITTELQDVTRSPHTHTQTQAHNLINTKAVVMVLTHHVLQVQLQCCPLAEHRWQVGGCVVVGTDALTGTLVLARGAGGLATFSPGHQMIRATRVC